MVLSPVYADQLFGEITNLIVSLKFRQLLAREKLNESIVTWETLDSSPRGDRVRHAVLKLLRMAALMKYIMDYPTISSKRRSPE